MNTPTRLKVWLTCPETHADALRTAIGDAGIGTIGNYSHCSFVSKGTGYFKPLEGAHPNIGTVGSIESVSEVVIEFVCTMEQVPLLKEIVKTHHPYEEVAMDFFPLLDV